MHKVVQSIHNIKHLNEKRFFLIAGPCVIENEEIPYHIAEKVKKITDDLRIPFIFKASYRKANRSRLDSFTGIGNNKALGILKKIGKTYNIPTLTDIHTENEAALAAGYVDILQIPAFLCRQTDILVAAAKAGKPVNIKKGQFISGEAMKFAVDKVRLSGNEKVMLTERGSMFGYQDLVVDYRNIPAMQQFDVPVVMDITHSLQQPNLSRGISGGRPEMIETIARAGIAAGADGLFIETHPEPGKALSDGDNMLNLTLLERLLERLVKIREALI
ncbi:MAG: 3-deoxy-8-phosphooctulonate synthase [Bacteroidales bacterium]